MFLKGLFLVHYSLTFTFDLYMLPPGTFIKKKYHIFYHSYADDTQMHVLFSSDDLTRFQK